MIRTPAHKQTDPAKAGGVIRTLGDYVTQATKFEYETTPDYVFHVPTGSVPRTIYNSLENIKKQEEESSERFAAFVPPRKIEDPKAGIGDINSTEKGSGARYNAGKAPLELIPLRSLMDYHSSLQQLNGAQWMDTEEGFGEQEALQCLRSLAVWQESGKETALSMALIELGDCWEESARVFDYGRKKYADWNWAKGMKWSVPLACAARHLKAILDGEELDAESGLPHRAHVYCNIIMLQTFTRTYPEGDDRPRCLA